MFNIGLSEIFVVVVIFILVTDPKKAPDAVRSIRGMYKRFMSMKSEIIDCIYEDHNKILGQDGKYHRTYMKKTDIIPVNQEIDKEDPDKIIDKNDC
ncbi:MAG: hypothetical protein P857_625 [Candidatus Xenolissoclinum pacificiensis L6]|uniref:Uncharacterized protein n=1 Tax=Candidatus Xenolissoclinum pacificiensis L6 TaxID=1401685 RepID=W2UYY2_9RICK|nr:MAG: hypothetical protein P857_625 [Candidatus Xenolissoclinum pacificiensis L6]